MGLFTKSLFQKLTKAPPIFERKEQSMKDSNYITIQGWMINQLKLKGTELMAYAIIYGFSQDEQSVFSGTLGYLSECAGVSKQAMCATLKKLVEKNLIIKIEKIVNGVVLYDYKAVQKTLTPIKETLMPPIKETLTVQDIYNNNNIKTRINYVNTVKSDNPDVEKAKNIWNSFAGHWGLAQIRTLTADRKKKLELRLKEQNMTIEQFFEEIRIALEDSPFLRGRKWHVIPGHPDDSFWEDADWRADFDFFLQPSSLQKAIEGKYADPTLRKERQRKQK